MSIFQDLLEDGFRSVQTIRYAERELFVSARKYSANIVDPCQSRRV